MNNGYEIHHGVPAVIMLNSDIPPTLAIRFNGRNTTLISVSLRSRLFMLLFIRLPRASISPENTLE